VAELSRRLGVTVAAPYRALETALEATAHGYAMLLPDSYRGTREQGHHR
jgi:hypothetical protein